MPDFLEVEGPDGRIVEFPVGTDGATIDRAMQQIYLQQPQAPVSESHAGPSGFSAPGDHALQNAPTALKTAPQPVHLPQQAPASIPQADNPPTPMNVTGGAYGAFDPYSKPVVPAERPGIVQTALEKGTAIKKAFTGEGQPTQYPGAPELTQANVGFMESAIPNLKAGLTTDPVEKAKIIAAHFQGDPRFGGIYQDDQGLPFVLWEGRPHYVNKPGFSKQDATDILAQGIMFAPASRMVGGATTLAGRAATALPLYAGTDAAQQYGTVAAGGKEKVDLGQSGTAASVGALTEALLPGPLKAGAKVMTPSKPSARLLAGNSGAESIPLTRGQRSGNLDMLRTEEGMRQGGYGNAASGMLRNFDDAQMAAIENRAGQLVPSGFGPGKLPDTGARLQSDLMQEAGQQRQAIKQAYEAAGEAKAALDPQMAVSIASDLKAIPKNMKVFSTEGMTQLNAAIDKLKGFEKLGKRATLKPIDIQQLEDFRKGLVRAIGGTKSTEQAALIRMKNTLDQKLDNAVTSGLFQGDDAALDLIKNARDLRARYGRLFEAGNKDPAGNAMVRILDDKQASPEQVINFILGAGKVRSTSQAHGLVKRIKDVFGPDSEQVQALKDALLYKAFTNVQHGEHKLARTAIAVNARNLLDNEGRYLARELFSEGELDQIRRLANEVARTITPQDARNPSRSAWAFLHAMQQRGFIGTLGKITQAVPVIGATGDALENIGGTIQSGRAVSQKPELLTAPLVTGGVAAAALEAWESRPQDLMQLPQSEQHSALPQDRFLTGNSGPDGRFLTGNNGTRGKLAAMLTAGAPEAPWSNPRPDILANNPGPDGYRKLSQTLASGGAKGRLAQLLMKG